MSAQITNRIGRYSVVVSPIQTSFIRISDRDDLSIGSRNWRVITWYKACT